MPAILSLVKSPTLSARLARKRLERNGRITEEDISPDIKEKKKTWKEVCFSFQTPYLVLKVKETSLLHLSAFQEICYILSYFENISSQLPEGALEGESPLGLRLYSLSPFQDSVCSQTRLEGDAEEQR